jgi:hypothetical protein
MTGEALEAPPWRPTPEELKAARRRWVVYARNLRPASPKDLLTREKVMLAIWRARVN